MIFRTSFSHLTTARHSIIPLFQPVSGTPPGHGASSLSAAGIVNNLLTQKGLYLLLDRVIHRFNRVGDGFARSMFGEAR